MPIIEKYRTHRGGRITIPEEIQTKHGHIPEGVFRIVADPTGPTLVDIYGAATFYKTIHLVPRGKHLTSECRGTACHVWGGPAGGGSLP